MATDDQALIAEQGRAAAALAEQTRQNLAAAQAAQQAAEEARRQAEQQGDGR